MNIYKVSQSLNNDYDTYDSMIVCAESTEDARQIHPSGFVTHKKDGLWYGTNYKNEEYETDNRFASWVQVKEVDKLTVEFIGVADSSVEPGVILASYKAG